MLAVRRGQVCCSTHRDALRHSADCQAKRGLACDAWLFLASPVLGALYLVGWGASLGGLAGVVVGAERSKGDVSSLVKDALANGQVVLVVHARTEAETAMAQQIVSQHLDPVAAPLSRSQPMAGISAR